MNAHERTRQLRDILREHVGLGTVHPDRPDLRVGGPRFTRIDDLLDQWDLGEWRLQGSSDLASEIEVLLLFCRDKDLLTRDKRIRGIADDLRFEAHKRRVRMDLRNERLRNERGTRL